MNIDLENINEENDIDENNEDAGRKAYLEILKAAHHPLELSHFSQKTQDEFREVAQKTRNHAILKLKTQADLHALSNVIWSQAEDNHELFNENREIDTSTAEGKIFKKETDLIAAFKDKCPISFNHPNAWISVRICRDKTIAECDIETPFSRVYHQDEFHLKLYMMSRVLLDKDVLSWLEPSAHEFLAECGVKLTQVSHYEKYFEYSQKFIDELFNEGHFKFNKDLD